MFGHCSIETLIASQKSFVVRNFNFRKGWLSMAFLTILGSSGRVDLAVFGCDMNRNPIAQDCEIQWLHICYLKIISHPRLLNRLGFLTRGNASLSNCWQSCFVLVWAGLVAESWRAHKKTLELPTAHSARKREARISAHWRVWDRKFFFSLNAYFVGNWWSMQWASKAIA